MALLDPDQELAAQAAQQNQTTQQQAATAPASNLTPTAAPQPAAPMGLGAGSTDVGDVAAGLMDKDSMLMKKAAATGMQYANRRGLLNSTMAGQAAQSAMLDHIVPMASQTSEQRFRGGLQQSEQAFTAEQAAQDRALKLDLAGREEALQYAKFEHEATQAEFERQLKLQLDQAGIAEKDRRGAESMLANNFRDYEESLRSILNNPELPADERAKLLENSKKMLSAKIQYTNQLYGTEFSWPENPWGDLIAPPPTDTTGGTTTPPPPTGGTTTGGTSGGTADSSK